MTKRDFLKIAASGAAVLFGGCAGAMQKAPIAKTSPVRLPFKDEVLAADPYEVKNGFIVGINGEKIFDEEGDILYVFKAGNGWFYLLKIPNNRIYKIKSLKDRSVVRTFRAALVNVFPQGDKAYIGVMFANYNVVIYDNIYLFDGSKFSLSNKNVKVYGRKNDSVFYITIDSAIDIRTGKNYTTYDLGKKLGFLVRYYIGSVEDKLVFVYSTGLFGNNVLGVYDATNDKFYDLFVKHGMTDDRKIQFLKGGKKVVLKLPRNENRYVYINNMVYVKGIDPNFKPIVAVIPYQTVDSDYLKEYTLTDLFLSVKEHKNILF